MVDAIVWMNISEWISVHTWLSQASTFRPDESSNRKFSSAKEAGSNVNDCITEVIVQFSIIPKCFPSTWLPSIEMFIFIAVENFEAIIDPSSKTVRRAQLILKACKKKSFKIQFKDASDRHQNQSIAKLFSW